VSGVPVQVVRAHGGSIVHLVDPVEAPRSARAAHLAALCGEVMFARRVEAAASASCGRCAAAAERFSKQLSLFDNLRGASDA